MSPRKQTMNILLALVASTFVLGITQQSPETPSENLQQQPPAGPPIIDLASINDTLIRQNLGYYLHLQNMTDYYGMVTMQIASLMLTDDCQRNQTGYFDNSTQTCKTCSQNCQFCNQSTCFQCASGFNLISNFLTGVSTCQPCMSNCSSCYPKAMNDTALKCLECQNMNQLNIPTNDTCAFNQTSCMHGYYYNSTTLNCEKCMQGCRMCNNDSSCQQCDQLMGLVFNQTTMKCENVSTQTPPQQQCIVGMYYDNISSQCMNCSANCTNCLNSNTCNQCKNDSHLSPIVDGVNQCIPNNSTQTKCLIGQFYNYNLDQCYQCGPGCSNCSDFAHCNECMSEHFTLKNGYCLDQCENKTMYPDISMTWNNVTKTCTECPLNCQNCIYNITTNQTECMHCVPGYENLIDPVTSKNSCSQINCTQPSVFMLNSSSSLCDYCGSGCQNCSDETSCDICRVNFKLFEYSWNPQTQKSLSYCSPNCPLGQQMKNLTTGECVQCPANCSSCSGDDNTCYSCFEGFYLEQTNSSSEPNSVSQQCMKCPQENCRNCMKNPISSNSTSNDISCYYCIDGFKVDWSTQQCVPAPNCPSGFYYDQSQQRCLSCSTYGCDKCGQFTNCSKCLTGFSLNDNKTCSNLCTSVGQYFNQTTNKCEACSDAIGCLQCKDSQNCSVCKKGYAQYFNPTINTTQCVECTSSCSFCYAFGSANFTNTTSTTRCQLCDNNFKYNYSTGLCDAVKNCPVSTYFDQYAQQCLSCSNGCKSCSSFQKCTECLTSDGSQTLINDTCLPTCEYQMVLQKQTSNILSWLYFDPPTKSCKNCSISSCSMCHFDNITTSEKCHRCLPGYQLSADNLTCTAINCEQTGVFKNGTVCEYCAKGCLNCPNKQNCDVCMNDMTKDLWGQCQPACTQNQFYNYTTQMCQGNLTYLFEFYLVCGDENCNRCSVSSGTCLSCTNGTMLYNNSETNTTNCINCPDKCERCQLSNMSDGNSVMSCEKCMPGQKLDSLGQCKPIDYCEMGKFFDWNCQTCQHCHQGCSDCSAPNNCTSCHPDFMLIESNYTKQCVPRCKEVGKYYDTEEMICQNCSANCIACDDTENCGQCQRGYALAYNRTTVLNMELMQQMQDNSTLPKSIFIEGATCQKCPENCGDCFMNQNSKMTCSVCMFGYKLQEGLCVKQTCLDGAFFNPKLERCQECPRNCSKCLSPFECTQCSAKINTVYNGTCVDKCQLTSMQLNISHYYDNQTETCKQCGVSNCQKCSNSTNCNQCQMGYSWNMVNSTTSCLMCPDNCNKCSYGDSMTTKCDMCQLGFELNPSGVCVPIKCSNTTYILPNSTLCDYCPQGCLNCSSKYSCNKCQPGFIFEYWSSKCVSNCSVSQFFNQDTQKCDNCSGNCTNCVDKTSCISCQRGFYQLASKYSQTLKPVWDKLGQVCLNCTKGCDNCTLNYDDSQVQTFLGNANFTGYDLLPTCMLCAPGYNLNSTTGICDKSESCPQTNMYFNETQDRCLYCASGCNTCSSINSCSQCATNLTYNETLGLCMIPNSNYTYSTNNTANSSMMNSTNSTTNNSSNPQCGNLTFFNTTTQQCQPCSVGCQQCSQNGTCLICQKGYSIGFKLVLTPNNQWMNTSICQIVQQNQSTGGIIQCAKLNEYFNVQMRRCVQCTAGCMQCSVDGSCMKCMPGLNFIETTSGDNICRETCPQESALVKYQDGSIKCVKCEQDCALCNSTHCLECKNGTKLQIDSSGKQKCLANCPSRTYFDNGSIRCEKCSSDCATCNGPLSQNCLSCPPNKILNEQLQTCTNVCPTQNQFVDYNDLNKCKDCDVNQCATCIYNSTFCQTCNNGFILNKTNHQCISASAWICPNGMYLDKSTLECQKCHSTCQTCSGPESTKCLSCPIYAFSMNTTLSEKQCMGVCPDGMFGNSSTGLCQSCQSTCSKCANIANSILCTECASPLVSYRGQCLESCPAANFLNSTKCQQCSENCQTCTAQACTQCKEGFKQISQGTSTGALKLPLFQNQCLSATSALCPKGTFYDLTLKQCITCNAGCADCSSLETCILTCNSSATDCIGKADYALGCKEGFTFIPEVNKCVIKCEDLFNFTTNSITKNCDRCQAGCSNCTNPTTCTQCASGLYSFRHPMTNQLHCIRDCELLSQEMPTLPKLFNDKQSMMCKPCSNGCLKCSQAYSYYNVIQPAPICEICSPFSFKQSVYDYNTWGMIDVCQCLFNYQVEVSKVGKMLRVLTQDVQWASSLLNVTLPCSAYFQAFRREQSQCYPWYMPQNNSMNYQNQSQDNIMLSHLIELRSPNLLDMHLCEVQSITRQIYVSQVNDYVPVQETHIKMNNLPEEVMSNLLKKQLIFKLNENNFARKNCVEDQNGPSDKYHLRIIDALWIGDKVYDYFDSQPGQNSSNGNNSGSGSNGNNATNNGSSMNQSLSVNIFLNNQELRIQKCQPEEQSTVQILYSKGFETGYKQIQWKIDIIEELTQLKFINVQDNTTTNNSERMNDDYQIVDLTDMQLIIESLTLKSMGQLALNLQSLHEALPMEVQAVHLNISIIAINMLNQQVQKRVHAVMINSPKIEVILDQIQIKIAPQQTYTVAPWWIEYGCNGIVTKIKLTQEVLKHHNLSMSCSVMTAQKRPVISDLLNCTIMPWQLSSGQQYIVNYKLATPYNMVTDSQIVTVEQVIPACKIAQGSQILIQPDIDNRINAIIREDININTFNLKWICWYRDQITGKNVECNDAKRLMIQKQSLNFTIPSSYLGYSGIYWFVLSINDKVTEQPLSNCSIQVQTSPSVDFQVTSFKIIGDINEKNTLDLSKKSYVFTCEANQNLSNIYLQKFNYSWSLISSESVQVNLTNSTIAVQTGKYLRLSWTAFEINKEYIISCLPRSIDDSKVYVFGSTTSKFNTYRTVLSDSTSYLNMVVSPLTDVLAFSTNVTIKAQTISDQLFYCVLGYTSNNNLAVTILSQSKSYESAISTTHIVKLPSGQISISFVCQDPSGNVLAQNQTIEVNKVIIDESNQGALSDLMFQGTNSTDSGIILQSLKLKQDLGETSNTLINSTSQASLLKNSIQQLILSQQDTPLDSNSLSSAIEKSTKIEVLQVITTSLKNNVELLKDKQLLGMTIQAYLSTVDSTISGQNQTNNTDNTNQSAPFIERRQNGQVVEVNLIDVDEFQTVAKIAGDLLNQTKDADLTLVERRALVSAFIQNLDQYSGSLAPNQQFNNTYGDISYSIVKIAQNDGTGQSNIVSLEMKSRVNISINASESVFASYENVIFKAVAFDRSAMNDTQKPATDSDFNSTMKQIVHERLASDILIITVDNSPETFSQDGKSYMLNQTSVSESSNMTMPIQFDISVDQMLSGMQNSYKRYFECRTFNEAQQVWEALTCSETTDIKDDSTSDVKVKCCTSHLSQFTVFEVNVVLEELHNSTAMVIEYSDDMFVRVATMAFDIFLIVLGIAGCILDRCHVLHMYSVTDGRENKYEDIQKGDTTQQQIYGFDQPKNGFGNISPDRQKELEEYERQYHQNLKNQLAIPAPNANASFDNSMLNQTNYPMLQNNVINPIPIIANLPTIQLQQQQQQQLSGRPMDARVRPPYSGHKISEQNASDSDEEDGQNQQRYEGGSSEEDNESQNVQHQAKEMSRKRKEKKSKKSNNKKTQQQLPAINNNSTNTRLFQKVDRNTNGLLPDLATAQPNDKKSSNQLQTNEKKKQKKTSQELAEQQMQDGKGVASVSSSQEKKKAKKKTKDISKSDDDDSNQSSNDHDHVRTKGGDAFDDTNRGGKPANLKANVLANGKLVLPSQGILQPDDSDNNQSSRNKEEEDDERPEDHSAARVLGGYSNNQGPQDQRQVVNKGVPQNNTTSQSLTNGEIFCRAIKCYHRVVGVIFKESPFLVRFLKVLSAATQFHLILMITGLLTMMGEMAPGGSLIITIILMRFIQILCNIAPQKADATSLNNCRNITFGIVMSVVFIVSQIISMSMSRDKYQFEIDDWKSAFIGTFFIEVLAFDILVNPVIILLSMKYWCSRASYRFLSPALTRRRNIDSGHIKSNLKQNQYDMGDAYIMN